MPASDTPRSRRSQRRRALLVVAASMSAPAVAIVASADAAATHPVAPAPARTDRGKPPISPQLAAEIALDLARRTERWFPGAHQDRGRSIVRDRTGRLAVDVAGAPVPVGAISALGGEVVALEDGGRRATVLISPGRVTDLAALAGVRYVAGVQQPVGDGLRRSSAPAAVTNAACEDRVVSEGDGQLRAAVARTTYGVDGSGVRVGVVSDSYNDLGGAIADVGAGELPGPSNPCGRTMPVVVQSDLGADGTDEGRAMAQIVHDLAPGAELAVATASFGELDMAQQIRDLAAGGADITTDDILWLTEPLYEEGPIADAIADNRAEHGVAHFSSAGNSHLVVGGQPVGGYETDRFRPAPCPRGVVELDPSFVCHDYAVGAPVDVGSGITLDANGSITMMLGWAEPRNGVTTDLDLFVVDRVTGLVVAGSADDSPALGRAGEAIRFQNRTGGARGYDIVVGRYGFGAGGLGQPRFRQVFVRTAGVTGIERTTAPPPDRLGPTLIGHSGSQATVSVAAVPYDDAATVEPFSSRGPALTCIDGGAPATCAATTVDLAATDGTANSFFGVPDGSTWRFFGTSAAAPHAAAVAALVNQQTPCATAEQIETALTSTAVTVGTSGVHAVGAGLIDAAAAVGSIATRGECPTITPIDDVDFDGRNRIDLPFAVSDPDTPDANLSIQLATSNPTAVPRESISTSGTLDTLTLTLVRAPEAVGVSTVTVTVTDDQGLSASTSFSVTVDGGRVIEPTTPARFADSRDEPTFDGRFRRTGRRSAESTWEIEIAGRGDVPADAVGAVVNVTTLNGEAPGFATVYPCGALPLASSLNYAPGTIDANELVAKLSPQGTICIYTYSAADVIVDVVGYLPAQTDYTPLTPTRFADSRDEPTFDGAVRNTGPRVAGTTWEIPVAGRGDVPADATTIIANVTVTNGQAEGFATVHPCDPELPVASSLNYGPGITRPNEVIARLSPAGTLCVFTFSTADVIVDVVGHLGDDADFVSSSPLRFADSRDEPTFDGGVRATGRRAAGSTWEIPIAGRGGVPADATTVVANVTVTNGQAEGFATVHPCGELPLASSLNYAPGVTRPNEVVAELSPRGTLCVFTFAEVDVIVDVTGHA